MDALDRPLFKPRRSFVVIAAVASLSLLGCGSADPTPTQSPGPITQSPPPTTTPTGTPPPTPPVIGERSELSQGLEAPWSIAFAGEAPLISQRDNGVIRERLSDGSLRDVGTVPGVQHGGEGGLLGIATDPADDSSSHLYVYSTAPDGNRVQRFTLEGNEGELSLGSSETLLANLPAGWSHNGGRLAFGPDGHLYVSVGDAGDTAHSQNIDSLAGKILRIRQDGSVPADNPFEGSPVWSYGHRNVQGMTWDDKGVMYASEFGQDTWDELNIIEAGKNYGWPTVEGAANQDGFVDPVQQWTPADASPSGIAHVRGTLFIANLRGMSIRTVEIDDLGSSETLYRDEVGRIRDVVAAPDGSVWFLSNNTDGRITPNEGDDRIFRVQLD